MANSKRGTQFRIWAANVLQGHLVRGFTLNEMRLRVQDWEMTRDSKAPWALSIRPSMVKSSIPASREKAANLLYFVVKNHAFRDGNKRIAAALFVVFLCSNKALYRKDGSKRIAGNALVAITLMIAESNPADKETMVKLIDNLIKSRN